MLDISVELSLKHDVIAFFNKKYVKEGIIDKQFSKILMSAEKIRIESDYDDFFVADAKKTAVQLKNAEVFLNEIKRAVREIYNLAIL